MSWGLLILIIVAAVLGFLSWCVGGAAEDPHQAEGGDTLRQPVQRKFRDAPARQTPPLRLVRPVSSDENRGDC